MDAAADAVADVDAAKDAVAVVEAPAKEDVKEMLLQDVEDE